MINLPNASQSTKSLNPHLFGKANPQEEQQQVPKGSIKRGMNKTEAEFAQLLEAMKKRGDIDEYGFEEITLKLGHDCQYTPDFYSIYYGRDVQEGDCDRITFYEVKGGHIWDDSKVKFRVATDKFQWASFQMWQKKKGKWSQIL